MVTKALVLGDHDYGKPYESMGFEVTYRDAWSPVPPAALDNQDIVLFTGGEDVSPALYGEFDMPRTHANAQRDLIEVAVWRTLSRNQVPMQGICRGSQFLRVMQGGRLYQHIDNHGIGGQHDMLAVDEMVIPFDVQKHGLKFTGTSTHHQAAVPDPAGYRFADILSGHHKGQEAVEGWIAHGADVTAVQYHPEYMDPESTGFKFFCDLARFQLDVDQKDYTFYPYGDASSFTTSEAIA